MTRDTHTPSDTPSPLPDPDRLGGPGWVRSTGARLTWPQRGSMLATSIATQGRLIGQRARRRRSVSIDLDDAICVHTTIGVDPARDGALGAYTQFGAMVDLAGLRERHLPYDLVARTVADHPRSGFVDEILVGLRAEARAVPGGRFAFLRCVGFAPAVRLGSVPSRR